MKWLFLPLLLQSFTAFSQNNVPDCVAFKTGIYYSYPRNTGGQYSIERKGKNEIEKNLETGDSTVWEIRWLNGCTYTLRYVRGNEQLKAREEKFLYAHQVACKIETITPEYYVYSAYVDEVAKKPYAADTIWYQEKTDLARSESYRFIPGENWLRKRHFSDTSRYAVIYLYRPGQTMLSLSRIPVYCNDTALWIAKNKSACILMVRSEGPVELKSRLYKDSSSVKLDVRFGQRYYVKSMIHWGLHAHLYNFKLEMAAMKPEEAKPEFDDIAGQQ